MYIYTDPICDALGIRPISQVCPDFDPYNMELPDDAKLSHWTQTGFQWKLETHGPMKDYHPQTWKGDNRTNSQKEAARKHSERWHLFGKTPTPKGGTMSEEHKKALRVPRPGAGKHNGHVKGENHFAKKILTCPHCGKQGGGGAIKRWHFDNCKTTNK